MNNLVFKGSDEQVLTSSLIVAEVFGKRHDNVLQAIENLITENSGVKKWFAETTYVSRGKKQPMYAMTKDGFTLLAMGFTGKKAMEFKVKYISAFNEMEKQLNKPMSTLDMIIESAKELKEQQRLNEDQAKKNELVDKKILNLEARSNTSDSGFYTVMGYGNLINNKVTLTEASALGKRATSMSKGLGIQIGYAKDVRFGKVSTYHEDVLAEVFK